MEPHKREVNAEKSGLKCRDEIAKKREFDSFPSLNLNKALGFQLGLLNIG